MTASGKDTAADDTARGEGEGEDGRWSTAVPKYTPHGEAMQVAYWLEARMRGGPRPPMKGMRQEVIDWLQTLDDDDICLFYDSIKKRRLKVSDVLDGKRDIDGKRLDDGLVPWRRVKRKPGEPEPDLDAAPVLVARLAPDLTPEEPEYQAPSPFLIPTMRSRLRPRR